MGNILKSLREKLESNDLVSVLTDNAVASVKDEVVQGVLQKFTPGKSDSSEKDNILIKEDNILVYVNTFSENQARSLFYNTSNDKLIAKIGDSKEGEDFEFGSNTIPVKDSSSGHFSRIILKWCAEVLNLAPAVGVTQQDSRYLEIQDQLSKNLVCPTILNDEFLLRKIDRKSVV